MWNFKIQCHDKANKLHLMDNNVLIFWQKSKNKKVWAWCGMQLGGGLALDWSPFLLESNQADPLPARGFIHKKKYKLEISYSYVPVFNWQIIWNVAFRYLFEDSNMPLLWHWTSASTTVYAVSYSLWALGTNFKADPNTQIIMRPGGYCSAHVCICIWCRCKKTKTWSCSDIACLAKMNDFWNYIRPTTNA